MAVTAPAITNKPATAPPTIAPVLSADPMLTPNKRKESQMSLNLLAAHGLHSRSAQFDNDTSLYALCVLVH